MNSKPESENSFTLSHQAGARAADSHYATYISYATTDLDSS
jgi:hypothetical protein